MKVNFKSPKGKLVLGSALGLSIILSIAGVAIGVVIYGKLKNAKESKEWPVAEATILELDTYTMPISANFHPSVRYSYIVEGKGFEGDRLTFWGGFGEIDKSTYRRLKEGESVAIHYHPTDHSISTISTRFDAKDQWILAFPVALAGFGLLIITTTTHSLIKG